MFICQAFYKLVLFNFLSFQSGFPFPRCLFTVVSNAWPTDFTVTGRCQVHKKFFKLFFSYFYQLAYGDFAIFGTGLSCCEISQKF